VGVRVLPERFLARLYFLARHRFFMDEWMERLLIAPLLGLARGIDRLERKTVEGDADEPLEGEQATSLSHGGAR
jgi:hypothetical protein